jgi:hypothetical protein
MKMSDAAAGFLLFGYCALAFAGGNSINSQSIGRKRAKLWFIVALMSTAASAGLFFYQR